MELYQPLYGIAKLLLQAEAHTMPELLLRHVLDSLGAGRGFIVIREAEGFAQRFQVGFDRESVSDEERRFSRSIVKEALKSGEVIQSRNPGQDLRFAGIESVRNLGEAGVLVAPLQYAGEVYGAVYVQHDKPLNIYSEEAAHFLKEFAEVAALSLQRALAFEELRRQSEEASRTLFADHQFPGLLTHDPKMIELLKVVAQVADSDATVLVGGESGTGKELIVQALHLNSSRRNKPFVVVHCTALPATVLESELFGHKRGAYTGADRDRPGRFASAAGGTVFLDEIAEVPLELQAKLLRFLQFGEIQRLGADRVETVDVRVVAATHQDLPKLVEKGRFRQDLYYRLKVVELQIPPLRERRGDIPLLLEHFTRRAWKREGAVPPWSREALRVLSAHRYPGNVRELEHIVERACLLARGPELGVELLPPDLEPAPAVAPSFGFTTWSNDELKQAREQAQDAVEREFLRTLLESSQGNISEAARRSGISRPYLQRLVSKHREGLGSLADKGQG
jgi:transcriptional regulator with GAF, ATPase, and Fis domain